MIIFTHNPKERESGRSYKRKMGGLPNNRPKTKVGKYKQSVGNGSKKRHGPLKEPHKVVTEANDTQIKTNIFEHPLGTNNNLQKEAETEYALT
jgi:hypothetical protein